MNQSRTVHLTVAATFEDVRKIDEAVVRLLREAHGVSDETIYNVELAIHEICTNIVEHAYASQPAGRIDVVFTMDMPKRTLSATLRDAGREFDRGQVAPVDFDTPREGGYGLFLAEALMDEVRYERKSSHNVWHLKKAV